VSLPKPTGSRVKAALGDGLRDLVYRWTGDAGTVTARGTQIGVELAGYKLDYRLETTTS
jgi:hypothetical protein